MSPAPRDAALRRYLLGQLAASRRARIEERCMADEALFERMHIIEDELLDAYVRGEMEPAARQRFEAGYLTTPQGRQNLQSARALLQCLDEAASSVVRQEPLEARRQFPWSLTSYPAWADLRLAAAVLAGVAILAAGWLTTQNRRLGDELRIAREQHRVAIDAERARTDLLAREARRQQAARTATEDALTAMQRAGPVAVVVLSPGVLRDASGSAVVHVSARTGVVLLQLQLDDSQHASYRVRVRTVDNVDIWQQELSKPATPLSTSSLAVAVPASLFASGDYLVMLQGRIRDGGLEDLRSYYVRIARD